MKLLKHPVVMSAGRDTKWEVWTLNAEFRNGQLNYNTFSSHWP
jgi:hypothetical protein